ncbi:MAG: DUF1080 domain-containing protein [Verrucomicrobiaceae bacterium]|nr:DUF1080 domain-containing protein [Verrucomicrobiaceae bacterium]
MSFRFSLVAFLALATSMALAEEGFVPLFNGKDLGDWDGDPALWKVEDGLIVGTCAGPGTPPHNDFLIWRGGVLKDFELRVTARVKGDNNSGIQYRSRPLPEVGPWAITGYQSDIHPAIEHTGMTYEEKGRGIFGLNGQSVIVDREGQRWLASTHEPVAVDVAEWNDYTVIARGNHLVHLVNGRMTSQLTDYEEKGRALEGLLAFQLHSGNANTVEIRSVELKVILDAEVKPFTDASIPADATKIDRPGSQGVDKPSPTRKPK